MKVAVCNKVTHENLDRFKDIFRKHLQKKNASFRVVDVYIHKRTGELGSENDLANSEKNLWKHLVIVIHPNDPMHHFEVREKEGNSQFLINDIHPNAYKIFAETFRTLNIAMQELQEISNNEEIIEKLSKLECLLLTEKQSIILAAGYPVNRIQAEKLLLKQKTGYYLFRKDEYASILEKELQAHFGSQLACCTLSYLQAPYMVSERTIVKNREGWLFYNDDPTLSGPIYPTIYALLESLGDQLRAPLLRESA